MTELDELQAELNVLKAAKSKQLTGTATKSVSGDGDSIQFADVSIRQMNIEITRIGRRIKTLSGRGSIVYNGVGR